MGGQAGSTVEITITSQHAENATELLFSHSSLTATPKLDEKGIPIPDTYLVAISADCPLGIHEARLMTRLGISSSRAFNVGTVPEKTRQTPNTSLETAMPLEMGSICNAAMTKQSVDYYAIQLKKGQRIVVDCAAHGIDSKLKPVLILADAKGADLLVERRGGSLDFIASESATYVIKVHDLTFNGGGEFFYRLALREFAPGELASRLPTIKTVSSFSWPAPGAIDQNTTAEIEPNNQHNQAHKVSLPCHITGSFFPAADVDTFEFTAIEGEVWWVEVVSERLGLLTDPAVVVQQVDAEGTLIDIVELNDIPSPVKVSSNGYSYDGPPYNAGSLDILGKVEIKTDGIYRLQVRDLFGGTRNDPRNVYQLIIRKAQPDFTLVSWAIHMQLRNGDRNCLSKPLALRCGSTMAFEVVTVRRDGFDGEIELTMENLPDGVTASGLKIPAGESRGMMLLTADEGAPRGFSNASFVGRATIDGQLVTRPCRLASMQWPVSDQWSEIPSPRLLADVPVSVCESEFAPITIASALDKVWEVAAGEKLTVPLIHTRRNEFSGPTINLMGWSDGMENLPTMETSLTADTSEAVFDLAQTQKPGLYTVAFYGSAVTKYRYNPAAVEAAQAAVESAHERAQDLARKAAILADEAKKVPVEQQEAANQAAQAAALQQTAAEQEVTSAQKNIQDATAKSQPTDIVDIIVSTPIKIRVNPTDKAE